MSSIRVIISLKLISPEFRHGGDIPKRFTCEGDEVSPPLSWDGVPAGTKSFALVMEDRDAPPKKPAVHWIIYGIPGDAKILPENIPDGPQLADGLLHGKNDFKKVGYTGPCPKPGPAHRYSFTLYALKTELKLLGGATKDDLVVAMRGSITASAELMGKFRFPGVGRNPRDRKRARIQALEQDKEYVLLLGELQKRLEKAYAASPNAVGDFFQRYVPSPFSTERVQRLMRGIEDPDVRRALEDYVKFANQFRVALRLKINPLGFVPLVQPPYGEKFHARYVAAGKITDQGEEDEEEEGEHLESASGAVSPTDPYVDTFEDHELPVSETVQELIQDGKATFVQIEDGPGYSILKDLESFAYKDDGIAIPYHNAEQPRFLVLFGEKTKKDLMAKVGKALSEFQRKHFSACSRWTPSQNGQTEEGAGDGSRVNFQ